MAGASIVIDIIANDLLTPVISNLRGSYLGNLGADLTMAALNGVIAKINGIGSALQDAARTQTKFIADAASFGAVAGVGLQQSKDFMLGVTKELALAFAALPGTTDDALKVVNGISASLVKAYKNPLGQVDLKAYKADLIDITKLLTVLGQAKGLDGGDINLFTNRFLGTGSFSELSNTLAFGERNQPFMDKVKEELKKLGKTEADFRGLPTKVKADILKKVGKALVTDELLSELSNTADGMLQLIKDKIFGQYTGAFGFLREVKDTGGRTVTDAFTGFLHSWLGLGKAVGAIAQKLGISFDPLKPLVDIFDFLADVGTKADLWLSSINFSSGFDNLDLTGFGLGLYNGISGFWNGIIKNLLGFTLSIDTHDLVKAVVGFVELLVKGFIGLQANLDWAGVGRFIGLWLVKLPSIIIQALMRFNWALIPQTLLLGLVGFFKFLGGLLFGIAEGLLNEIPMILETWVDKILDNFGAVFDAFKGLADTVMSWIEYAQNLISNAGRAVVNSMPPEVKAAVENIPTPVKTAAKAVFSPSLENLIPGVGAVKAGIGLIDLMTGKGGTTNNTTNNTTNLSPTTINPVKPLTIPSPDKPQKVAGAFAPVINISAQSQADPYQIAQLVRDGIAKDYDRYVQGQLA